MAVSPPFVRDLAKPLHASLSDCSSKHYIINLKAMQEFSIIYKKHLHKGYVLWYNIGRSNRESGLAIVKIAKF